MAHFLHQLRGKPECTKMTLMDKTVKIRAYSEAAAATAERGNLTDEQHKSLEFAKLNSQLEEEKKKSLDQAKIIEQLKASLAQEQARRAEMEKSTGQNSSELAVKEAQLEEEKSRALGNLKMIVQLRESLKQEQTKTAEVADKLAELEAKTKALELSETKVKELAEALTKISNIAATGKAG